MSSENWLIKELMRSAYTVNRTSQEQMWVKRKAKRVYTTGEKAAQCAASGDINETSIDKTQRNKGILKLRVCLEFDCLANSALLFILITVQMKCIKENFITFDYVLY